MGNTWSLVVPLQHLLLPIKITALLPVSGLKDNVACVSYHVSEPSQSGLVAAFSAADFQPLDNKSTKPTTPEASTEEMQNVNSEESNKVAGVYSITCPQDACLCISHRASALAKHLSLEECTRSPEGHTVIDLAKVGSQASANT